MKWYDEVKVHYNTYGFIPNNYHDRLIEIVEKAEWSTEGLYRGNEVDACPICYARKVVTDGGHGNDCPYSDEWVPE